MGLGSTSARQDWSERLSHFDNWTPAQKSLSTGVFFAIPCHLLYQVGIDTFVGEAVNFDWVFWFGIAVVLFSCAVSLVLIVRSSSSKIPYYLLAYGYSSWALAVTVNVGAFDNTYAAFPLFILLVGLLFDGWTLAKHVIGYWSCAALVVWLFQTMGWLPYGSAFFNGDMLEIRASAGWLAVNILFMGLLIWSSCGILLLVINSRSQALMEVENSRNIIRHYLPLAVADEIIAGKESNVQAPKRRLITVLFADIAGFTDIADRVEPEVMTQVLSEHMSAMADIISEHNGTLNEFSGDGLMALFGAPLELEPVDQANQAIAAAKAMQKAMAVLNPGWRPLGVGSELKIRIGINTGMVSVGSYGSDGRRTYTAIGLQTNIAARIEAAAEPGEILVSDATYQLLDKPENCEARGEIECKGVHFPVAVHSVSSAAVENLVQLHTANSKVPGAPDASVQV